jgi:hypothetical protein
MNSVVYVSRIDPRELTVIIDEGLEWKLIRANPIGLTCLFLKKVHLHSVEKRANLDFREKPF